MKHLTFFIIAIAIFLFTPNFVFAQEEVAQPITIQVEYEKTNPSDGIIEYGLKRGKEKFLLILYSVSSSKKADYYNYLLSARLAELKKIAEEDDRGNIEKAAQRYWTTAGQYSEYITEKKLSDKYDDASTVFDQHRVVLQDLMDMYHGSTAEWRFLKHDFDYLSEYASKFPQ